LGQIGTIGEILARHERSDVVLRSRRTRTAPLFRPRLLTLPCLC